MHREAWDSAAGRPVGCGGAQVPAGSRIYAIGDIHGRRDLLDEILRLIGRDAGEPRWAGETVPQRWVVVFLGDYVDRGPDSRGVVERILAGPPGRGPLAAADWVALRGNHEDYMLRFLSDVSVGAAWCYNGGLDTVRSYAGALPDGAEGDMAALQLRLARAVPPAHLRFLARLPLWHAEGDYLFVHAGLRPGIAISLQDPLDLLWIRDEFLHSGASFGKVVVHGHSVTSVPEIRANRIGIDTGAYHSGLLTALVLEGDDRRFLVAGR